MSYHLATKKTCFIKHIYPLQLPKMFLILIKGISQQRARSKSFFFGGGGGGLKFRGNTRLQLVFSIQNLTRLAVSFLWIQNSIDQVLLKNKVIPKRYNIELQTFAFLPHPANVLSFSHQENIFHKAYLSTSISKNVFDFDQRHFTTTCTFQIFGGLSGSEGRGGG